MVKSISGSDSENYRLKTQTVGAKVSVGATDMFCIANSYILCVSSDSSQSSHFKIVLK